VTGQEAASELTQVGITVGTPLYMSPEQVEGKPLDPRSDVYSFGVTAYHMLTGSPPFHGETALGVAVQHLKKKPEPLESLRGDLPPSLCRIVHHMLAKDPSERPSARELLRELRRVRTEQFGNTWPEDLPEWDSSATEASVAAPTVATERLRQSMQMATVNRPRRWNRPLLALSMVVTFAVGAVAAWYFASPKSLLADAKYEVPRQSNVWRQWYFASQIGTEEQWQSILKYFPEKRDFALRAKQQLSLLYVREGDWDRATAIFDELASLGDEAELQAFGLAGKGVVLSLRGDCRRSAEVFAEFWPLRGKLKNGPMAELVVHAIRNNDAKLGSQSTQEWGKWFSEQFPEGS
jgi:serine/threonine-protein kinase